ncbi:hypothetical protein [Dactylosporangium cerinum]
MDPLVDRLDRIRGTVAPRNHNARTIAALTSNPGCGRRGLMDAAGVNKGAVAGQLGFPAGFGQSRFAIARGNAFEAQVKADGAAELLQLLRERLGLAIPEVAYDDLSNVGGNASREVRYARTKALLARPRPTGTTRGRSSTTRCCGWRSPGTTRTWSRTSSRSGPAASSTSWRSSRSRSSTARPTRARPPPPRPSPRCT